MGVSEGEGSLEVKLIGERGGGMGERVEGEGEGKVGGVELKI